jgi:alkylation response protein AidB-like acyl-CoA dehydrogenase
MNKAFAPIDVTAMCAQIESTPGIDRLRACTPQFAEADPGTIAAILDEAARFCAMHLAPINGESDRTGCTLESRRVKTPPGFVSAWQEYVDAGWSTLDHPVAEGGQGLPLFLSASVQQLVDASCAAFGMLPVLQRSAARLIAAHGDDRMRAEWLAPLVKGLVGASICISEADAGSDAARIRTLAQANADGSWTITGEKMWISFGDHDLCQLIAHCVLARSPAGLSLFLVPSELPGGSRNSVVVRRLESKMGLHGSPTCALGLEAATGWLIGTQGRGLAQMFVMITNMRLSAGMQGLGLAATAADAARAYASERLQGGPLSAPPVPIERHADVQLQLLDMVAEVEVLRGLGLAIAVQADLSTHDPDPDARRQAAALTQWLLPIFKTLGGEAGFAVASAAIQVFGGAGYTREWPVEQAARDARIATIYEGTTGMQALDLLHRRIWRDNGAGLAAFLAIARADIEDRAPAARCLELLEDAGRHLAEVQATPRAAEAGATAFLHLAGIGAMGWIASRLVGLPGDDAAARRLVAAGSHWLADIVPRAALQHARTISGAAALEHFAAL